MPPEEETGPQQEKTLSGISALPQNNKSLYSAKSTIFNLFMEGFSILFKATYLTSPHNGNILSRWGIKEERTCIRAFIAASDALSGDHGLTTMKKRVRGHHAISIKSGCWRPFSHFLSLLPYFTVMLTFQLNESSCNRPGNTVLSPMPVAFQVGSGITENICYWGRVTKPIQTKHSTLSFCGAIFPLYNSI